MASTNVNAGFAKCFISFMAIVILLQGCIYLALSVYGITQESCRKDGSSDISKNPFDFVLRLIYFQSESCGNPKVLVPSLSQEVEIDMVWSQSFEITNRMFIFLIAYASVSALWIATSLLVLVSICGTVTSLVAAISFWPWFSIVIGGCILDGVATGYYIHDILHTTTVRDTFTYIGADTTNENLMDILENFDAYFVTPAIVMACLSCRFVLIWLLNIFGTGFCLSLSHVLANNNSNVIKSERSSTVNGDQNIPEVHKNMRQPDQISKQRTPNQQAMFDELPYTSHQNSSISPDNHTPTPPVTVSQLSPDPKLNDSELLKPSQNYTTYRNTDTHPDRLDYPGAQAVPISPILPLEQVQHFSTQTPLNSRYTNVEVPQLSNQRVSAELRSQLPWSYTNMSGKPQAASKPHKTLYPDIPEPDYTT